MDIWVNDPGDVCVDGELIGEFILAKYNSGSEPTIINTGVQFSSANGFNSWIPLSYILEGPISSFDGVIDIYIHFKEGYQSCCEYETYFRNLTVQCTEELPNITKIPKIGFNDNTLGDVEAGGVQRVIDNKKSWVYNPGLPSDGVKLQDEVIRRGGDTGLIQGHGVINRQFAPSSDAELLYRYTDYQEQSSVLERHSDLVINSKEMFLTFNMTPVTDFCPDGYTLSASTICVKGDTTKDPIDVSLINLEEYKKTFQSFWVKMTEQFIPATTIFVSGEKWANNPNDICEEITECDIQTNLTDSDLSASINNQTDTIFVETSNSLVNGFANSLLITSIESQFTSTLNLNATSSDDNTIDFEALKVRSLQESPNSIFVNSGILVINNLDRSLIAMDNYRRSLNNVQEETIFI
jgi:hypothetical protein